MAMGSDFFWKLFQASGHIDAYLLYTDLRRLQQAGGELESDAQNAAATGPLGQEGLQAAGGASQP